VSAMLSWSGAMPALAARIAGKVKAATPLVPPWCSGRTPALPYPPRR